MLRLEVCQAILTHFHYTIHDFINKTNQVEFSANIPITPICRDQNKCSVSQATTSGL